MCMDMDGANTLDTLDTTLWTVYCTAVPSIHTIWQHKLAPMCMDSANFQKWVTSGCKQQTRLAALPSNT